MSEELLIQVIERLSAIENRIDSMSTNMATKDDISNMATKDDISNMATKDDISNMATKDDIMATRDDFAKLDAKFDVLTSDFARLEKKLDATFEQVAHNTEFEATVMELAATVFENTTDIKLLKKLVANY